MKDKFIEQVDTKEKDEYKLRIDILGKIIKPISYNINFARCRLKELFERFEKITSNFYLKFSLFK